MPKRKHTNTETKSEFVFFNEYFGVHFILNDFRPKVAVFPVRGGHKPTVVALTGNNRLYIRLLIFYIRLLIFPDTREQLTAERFFYILLL